MVSSSPLESQAKISTFSPNLLFLGFFIATKTEPIQQVFWSKGDPLFLGLISFKTQYKLKLYRYINVYTYTMYSSIPNSTKRSQLIYNLFKKSSINFWDIKIFSRLSLNFQYHLEGGLSFSHLLTPPAFLLRGNWITVVTIKCVALHGADPGRRLTAGSVWGRMTFADRGKKVTLPIKTASKRRPWVSWICSRLGEGASLGREWATISWDFPNAWQSKNRFRIGTEGQVEI